MNKWYQKLCPIRHSIVKLHSWNESETEFYYKCVLCGKIYWNEHKPKNFNKIAAKWDKYWLKNAKKH